MEKGARLFARRSEIVTDVFTKEKRSEIMSRIRGYDTKPERKVRSLLHHLGYRFRLHVTSLPGRPDIVLPRHRAVIMVHGCFWHRHSRCQFCYTPKTRTKFWQKKFAGNVLRDRRVRSALVRQRWRVMVIWECQTRDVSAVGARLVSFLEKPYGK
jgi:DNA mismatch endonuclease, patch repair protein